MPHPTKRDHLVNTARSLFQEGGYHRTGIDAILKCARMSKKTLYRHFRSKEELILAVLRHHDGVFRNDFMRRVDARADSPRAKLVAVFDVAESWFSGEDFYGCMFTKAAGEYTDKDSPIRRVCQEFKALFRGYLRELGEKAGAPDADKLADELSLLFDGAIVAAQISGETQPARTARRAAEVLIDGALSEATA